MKKFFASIALAAVSMTAFAHGPTPQKLDERLTIKADPATVWAVVKDYSKHNAWQPAVKSIKVEKKGADTFRTVSLENGGKVIDRIKSIDDKGMKIKFEFVEGGPVTNYNPYISVKAGKNAGESEVRYFHRFYRFFPNNPPIPEGQDDASAVKFIKDTYGGSLETLKKVVENSK